MLDVRLPPTYTTEGLDAAARIRREQPRTAVLVLSQHLEVAYAASLLEAAGAGSGYLLKDRVLETATLVDALRRVCAGECVLDPAIVAELVRVRRRGPDFAALTDREVEVLAGIAEGLTNVGIARQLGISDRTVEVHVQRLFTKLDLPPTRPPTGECSPRCTTFGGPDQPPSAAQNIRRRDPAESLHGHGIPLGSCRDLTDVGASPTPKTRPMNTPTMTNHRITILRSIASTVCLTTALLASPGKRRAWSPRCTPDRRMSASWTRSTCPGRRTPSRDGCGAAAAR